ncbi:MAG: hypothetical protein L3J06_01230 [Cyclobacteriaceae bacterium]|nr:hypothetical protein [Cyclobacteriaceae bacterium]
MKTLALLILVLFSTLSVHAQKVKYKDLYVLLRAKNYKDGSNFLLKFLADNPGHPNANYQMGLMLEFKLAEYDLLKESEGIINRADSAILYFNKAYSFINEKEVKKYDDDYYALFKRRNLRTGKFEVILSDVQLDIENRKNVLEKKKIDIISINLAFENYFKFYERARLTYEGIKELYKDELSLWLGANDSTVAEIKQIIIEYDSALGNFKKYIRLKKSFGSANDEAIITINSIENFSKNASVLPDFDTDKIEFSDFSEWGKEQIEQINLKTEFIHQLIIFDAALEEMQLRIYKDSIDLSSEIFKEVTNPTLEELKSIDSESLLNNLLHYKIAQINLNSILINWYKNYEDSMDIGAQLGIIFNLQKEMERVSALKKLMETFDDNLLAIRYNKFIAERYGTKEKLINYIGNQSSLIEEQSVLVNALVFKLREKDNWGFYGEDSIALKIMDNTDATYRTLFVDSLDTRKMRIVGMTKRNKADFFFFTTVSSSRLIDSLYFLKSPFAPNLNMKNFSIQSVKAVLEDCVFLMGDVVENASTAILLYYSQQTGINWHTTAKLNTSVNPVLRYNEGQIEIHQAEIVKKFSIDDGTLRKE